LGSFHEREPLEAYRADRGAVLEEEVGGFDRTVFRLQDVRPKLGPDTRAPANEHALERLLARDFEIDHELDGKFENVIHGCLLRLARGLVLTCQGRRAFRSLARADGGSRAAARGLAGLWPGNLDQ